MREISIKNRQFLEIRTAEGELCVGGNQDWYEDRWHQMSGCGPVAASNLIWYQALSHTELRPLCDIEEGGESDFIKLMDAMFGYITPGRGGVHSSGLFIPGLLGYCRDRGIEMKADCLEVSRKPRHEPGIEGLRDYLEKSLARDCPVAFLNLSNGSLQLPDSWHWVTILALETAGMTALISDEGRTYDADLSKWLETSVLGGCFVTLYRT